MTLSVQSRKEYERTPGMNVSALLSGATPAHVRAYLDNPPEQTDAMALGTATHLSVFEVGEYLARVIDKKYEKYSTKESREWRDERLAEGHLILNEEQRGQVVGMRDSLLARDEIREILESKGKSEVALTGKCPDTGLILKGRIDRIGTYQKWPCLFDLKTCTDCEAEAFTRHAYSMDYHCRAAWYLDLANLTAGVERRFLIIAIEKEAPYACRLFEFDETLLSLGRKKYKARLMNWAKAEKEKKYESFPVGVETLEAKPYMK